MLNHHQRELSFNHLLELPINIEDNHIFGSKIRNAGLYRPRATDTYHAPPPQRSETWFFLMPIYVQKMKWNVNSRNFGMHFLFWPYAWGYHEIVIFANSWQTLFFNHTILYIRDIRNAPIFSGKVSNESGWPTASSHIVGELISLIVSEWWHFL